MADEEAPNEDENTPGEDAESSDAEGAEGAEGEEGDGKKGGKKKLLIILVPLVLLIGGGAGAYFMGMLDGLLGKAAECVEVTDDHGEVVEECPEEEHGDDAKGGDDHGDDKGHGDKKKSGKKDKGDHGKKGDDGHGEEGYDSHSAFLAIPTMIVNLRTEDEAPRYLRLTVQLEMEDPADKGAVEAVIPRVIDQFQTYLRELRVKDLRGSAGIYRLQMELLWRVNQASSPVKVKDVLFQEILIQ